MFRLLFIIACIVLVSCTKDPATFNLENLNNNEIGCFGHAGMGTESIYPVNTLESFQSCLDRGADGTEMDVQVTKDSVLVIYHDENLNSLSSCSGYIRDLNWSDISNCKMNSTLFNNLEVLSFDEFIDKIAYPHNYVFTLDCKSHVDEAGKDAYYKLFGRAIARAIEKYGMVNNIFIEHPEVSFLNYIKSINPDAKLFLLNNDFDYSLKTAKENGYFGLSMQYESVTAEQIKMAHDSSTHVTLWGVTTDKENYAAVEKCPDFMQTDNIEYLLKIFGKYNRNKGYVYSITK